MTAAGRLGPPLSFFGDTALMCEPLERVHPKAGILGLEYMVELLGNPKQPHTVVFECCLCNAQFGTLGSAVHHVQQYTHKMNFLVSLTCGSVAMRLVFRFCVWRHGAKCIPGCKVCECYDTLMRWFYSLTV